MVIDELLRSNSSLSVYFRELNRYHPLPDEYVKQLIRSAHQGDHEAFNQAIQANLRFVVQVALDFSVANKHFEEMLASGNVGLIEAVKRFDPDLGYKFSTYAVWWIRRAIFQAIRTEYYAVRPPHGQLDDLYLIKRSRAELSQHLARPVTDEEIAENLDMPLNRVRAAQAAGRPILSLDHPLQEDSDTDFYNAIPDEEILPDQALSQKEMLEELQEIIQHLPSREAEIIIQYFGLEDQAQTLAQIGHRMGVSKERIRQIKEDALKHMRRSFQKSSILGN